MCILLSCQYSPYLARIRWCQSDADGVTLIIRDDIIFSIEKNIHKMKKILFVCERNVVMGPAAVAIFCHMGVSLLSRCYHKETSDK